jgi:putative hemolysin
MVSRLATSPSDPRSSRADALIDEVPSALVKAEIDALPPDQRLVSSGDLQVFWARAGQIPWALQEIGRLRELTFRAAGEGTGKCADIDLFDAYYLHMFVWDARQHAIAGAYRLGLVEEILARHGKRGLYTYSLFKFRSGLLEALDPAIELGRSFVRSQYQRSFAPLLLLWTGIARFVERRPRYAVLFGAVSISSDYSPASRRLIVDHLSAFRTETRLATQIRPRRPYRDKPRLPAAESGTPVPRDIDDLSHLIAQIEHDQKGVPVLLRQYLRLGGRLLGFSCDREFGDTLDGLIMVDLRQVEPTVLARYMGKPGAVAFHAYHSAVSNPLRPPHPTPPREVATSHN